MKMQEQFIILFLFYFHKVIGGYFIAKGSMTWEQANNQSSCALVGRELTGTFNPNTLLTDNLTALPRSWIGGYVRYTPWLKLLGCVVGNVLMKASNIFNIGNSTEPITECYYRCKGEFALFIDNCLCKNEFNAWPLEGCLPEPCRGNSQDLCGSNSDDNKCMCWYDPLKMPYDSKIGNCKTLNNEEFETERCSEKHPFVCRSGNSYTPVHKQGPLDWTNSTFSCYAQNMQFASPNHTNSKSWVGVFRKASYVWGHQPSDKTVHCLAVSKEKNDSLTVHIVKCNANLPVLCNATDESYISSPSVCETTEATYQSTPSPSKTHLIIGITVPVIFVVIIIIISIILIKLTKRKKERKRLNKESGISVLLSTSNSNGADDGFNEIRCSLGDSIYNELNEHTKKQEVNDTYDHAPMLSGDDSAYGHLGQGGKLEHTKKQEVDDTYDHAPMLSGDDSAYGHLGQGGKLEHTKKQEVNDTYDHAPMLSGDDSAYGHLGQGGKLEHTKKQEVDDTYDHAPMLSGDDSAYGHLGQSGKLGSLSDYDSVENTRKN